MVRPFLGLNIDSSVLPEPGNGAGWSCSHADAVQDHRRSQHRSWGWQQNCWIMALLAALSFSGGTVLAVAPRGGMGRASRAPGSARKVRAGLWCPKGMGWGSSGNGGCLGGSLIELEVASLIERAN